MCLQEQAQRLEARCRKSFRLGRGMCPIRAGDGISVAVVEAFRRQKGNGFTSLGGAGDFAMS
jgi:hypothetical protein